jgi:glycosyltransferase involved in cell wall biosynthesis
VSRFLVITNMYPPHHLGGYELSCRDVVERWRERGHNVLVLTSTMRLPGVDGVSGERDAGTRRDLEIAFRDFDLYTPPLRRRLAIERRNQQALAAALRAIRPDAVSLWHMGAMSTGLITALAGTGVPLVYVVCDDWLSYAPHVDPWMRMFVDRPRLGAVVQAVARVPATLPDVGASGTFCFVSELTRRRSEESTRWTYPEATVTYSGIDTTDFPVAVDPPERPWQWRLLHVGRLDPRKDIATAVRALAALPGVTTLNHIGPGDPAYKAQLQELAETLGVADRVSFETLPRKQLGARYAAADVLVFPPNWPEPFGLVPLEAMASGTPVVATGVGGSGEFLVDGENCLQFPPGDVTGLAEAVRTLAADADLRRRLVAGGLRTVADLTVDRLADVLEAWHVAAAERFAHGRPPHRRLDRAGR